MDDLWYQILSELELPSTRMLLSQQARLVRADKERVVIAAKENWIGMLLSRQPLLQQSVDQVLPGRTVVVIQDD